MIVNKTYIVQTDDPDEAHDLTKIQNDKVKIFSIGQIRPYDPDNNPQVPPRPIPPKG